MGYRELNYKALVLVFMVVIIMGLSACSNGTGDSDLIFDQTKTTGTVKSIEEGKLTIDVTAEDEYFSEGDHVIINYTNVYLDSSSKTSDVLEKIDSVSVGDTIYVTYGEDSKKDNVINVEYIVKEEQ